MAHSPDDQAQSALRQVAVWLRAMPGAAVLELASRAGYVARGAVYLSVGAIALLAALDLTPKAAGITGAMLAWADWPAGLTLLLLVGWGLAAFAGWRTVQALFDADRHGTSAKGLTVRAGQAISGVVHAVLALTSLELADGLGDLRELDEDGAARETAAQVLALPAGGWMLLAVGGFILVVGLANLVQAALYDFTKRLGCPPKSRGWAVALAKVGYFGRGVAFIPLGFFLAKAGLSARTAEVRSLGGALQALEQQPFGSWVMSLTALGLIAFGLFALVEARYRRMDVSRLAS